MVVLISAQRQIARIRGPDLEILPAMSGRGVDEARTGIVGDVFAFQKWHAKFVTAVRPASGWAHSMAASAVAGTAPSFLIGGDARLFAIPLSASVSATIRRSPVFAQFVRRRVRDPIRP